VAFNSSPEVSFPKTKRGVCPGRGSRRHGPRAPVDPWSAWWRNERSGDRAFRAGLSHEPVSW